MRIAADHDALCDAMVRAVDSHPDEATEIAEGLLRYWAATGGRSTGREWCRRVAEASSDPARQTRFGLYDAQLGRDEEDPGAVDAIERHIAAARDRHDRSMVGLGLTLLAPTAFRAGRIADAKQMASEAITLLRRGGKARNIVEALNVLGNVATVEGDQAAAFAAYEDALAIAREAGMDDVVNKVLLNLGSLSVARSNFVRAREYYTEARELAVAVGDTIVASAALTNLGVIAKAEGDYVHARRLLDQALAFKQELADARGTAIVLQGLADLDLFEGKLESARCRLRESLELSRSLDFSLGMISGLETFAALLARAATDLAIGLRIAASADAARSATGQRRSSEDTEEFDRVVAALRTGAGADDAQTQWDEGLELVASRRHRASAGSLPSATPLTTRAPGACVVRHRALRPPFHMLARVADLWSGTYTFLLTDIEGSTRLWETAPGDMARALVRHDDLITAVVGAAGGRLVRSRGEGDSAFAVFDDTLTALTAAVELQRAFHLEPWPAATPIRVRMAVHTGPAQARGDDFFGQGVNRAAPDPLDRPRRRSWSSPRTSTARSRARCRTASGSADLGLHRLKDLARPERVWQIGHPDITVEFPPLRVPGCARAQPSRPAHRVRRTRGRGPRRPQAPRDLFPADADRRRRHRQDAPRAAGGGRGGGGLPGRRVARRARARSPIPAS